MECDAWLYHTNIDVRIYCIIIVYIIVIYTFDAELSRLCRARSSSPQSNCCAFNSYSFSGFIQSGFRSRGGKRIAAISRGGQIQIQGVAIPYKIWGKSIVKGGINPKGGGESTPWPPEINPAFDCASTQNCIMCKISTPLNQKGKRSLVTMCHSSTWKPGAHNQIISRFSSEFIALTCGTRLAIASDVLSFCGCPRHFCNYCISWEWLTIFMVTRLLFPFRLRGVPPGTRD